MEGVYQHLTLMSSYHQWVYKTLFDALEAVDDEAYYAESGLFFGSIHGTLNHLLLAELVWFHRLHGRTMEITGLDQELYTERQALQEALLEQAQAWSELLASLPPEQLGATFSYTNTRGEPLSGVRWKILTHIFNHGTHHRGQITAAMTHLGLPGPALDLLYHLNPGA